jgi:hypothetical protein
MTATWMLGGLQERYVEKQSLWEGLLTAISDHHGDGLAGVVADT